MVWHALSLSFFILLSELNFLLRFRHSNLLQGFRWARFHQRLDRFLWQVLYTDSYLFSSKSCCRGLVTVFLLKASQLWKGHRLGASKSRILSSDIKFSWLSCLWRYSCSLWLKVVLGLDLYCGSWRERIVSCDFNIYQSRNSLLNPVKHVQLPPFWRRSTNRAFVNNLWFLRASNSFEFLFHFIKFLNHDWLNCFCAYFLSPFE